MNLCILNNLPCFANGPVLKSCLNTYTEYLYTEYSKYYVYPKHCNIACHCQGRLCLTRVNKSVTKYGAIAIHYDLGEICGGISQRGGGGWGSVTALMKGSHVSLGASIILLELALFAWNQSCEFQCNSMVTSVCYRRLYYFQHKATT